MRDAYCFKPQHQKSEELKKKIEDTTARELSKSKVESKIIVGETSVKQREAAHKLGVTPGKLVLIEEVSGYFSGADFEKMKNTAVKDLLEMVSEKRENQHPQKPEDKKDEAGKRREQANGAADKGANGAGGNAGAAGKGNGGDKDKEKDSDKAKDKDKGVIGSGIGAGANNGKSTGDSRNNGSGSNTGNNAKSGGSGQNSGPKGDKDGDSRPGIGAGKDNDKKAGNVPDSKSNESRTAITGRAAPPCRAVTAAIKTVSRAAIRTTAANRTTIKGKIIQSRLCQAGTT